MNTSQRLNPMIHDGIPVLPSQDLQRRHRFVSDSSAVQAEQDRNHDRVDLYLENSENRCWECVKVGCWCLIFKIKPSGIKQTVFECNQAPKPKHSHISFSSYLRVDKRLLEAAAQEPNYSLATKQLHAQQSEDHNEKEKEEQQADDRFHGVKQGYHQVPQGVPVPTRRDIQIQYIGHNQCSVHKQFSQHRIMSDDSLGDFEDPEQSQSSQDTDPK